MLDEAQFFQDSPAFEVSRPRWQVPQARAETMVLAGSGRAYGAFHSGCGSPSGQAAPRRWNTRSPVSKLYSGGAPE